MSGDLDFLTTTELLDLSSTRSYLWFVVLGGFVCVAMGWGIGANDVANEMSTSVASGAITLKQAVLIAALFEFIGAFFLGAKVTETVRKGIVDWGRYEEDADELMLGFFCALLSASMILAVVSKAELPVSTTQAIVGAIIGFAIAGKGTGAVFWEEVRDIVIFWLITPLFGTVVSIFLFGILRHVWLRAEDAFERLKKTWGFFVFLVAFIMTMFLILKGFKRWDLGMEPADAAWVAVIVGIVVSLIGWALAVYNPIISLDEYAKKEENDSSGTNTAGGTRNEDSGDGNESDGLKKKDSNNANTVEADVENVVTSRFEWFKKQALSSSSILKEKAMSGVNKDLREDLDDFELAMIENAESFDPRVERAFHWLQTLTAALSIMAHGSNDVANAIGPFSAMVSLYEDRGEVDDEVPVRAWVSALGAIGLVIGLSTYGYKVMKSVGVRMVKMTSSRGYVIELSSALVIIVGTIQGYPASSTHAQVGATIGVGVMEFFRKDSTLRLQDIVNWKLLFQIFVSWIFTITFAALFSGLIFSLLFYSPGHHRSC